MTRLEELAGDPDLAGIFAACDEVAAPEAAPSVHHASATPHRVLAGDAGRPYVSVSADGMTAHLALPPACDDSAAAITSAIQEAGIVFGLDEAKVADVLGGAEGSRLVLVARGRRPRPGVDGRLEDLITMRADQAPLAEVGFDRSLATVVRPVAAGTPLARLHQAHPGEPGIDVYGHTVAPAPAREARLLVSKGIEASPDDPNLLIAAADGAVGLDQAGCLAVQPLLILQGADIDRKVEFGGSILIQGDVSRGFTISAGGDIEVTGLHANGRLIAGGSILVAGGVMAGVSTPVLQAQRDVIVRRLEGALVRAGRDIIVQEAINCHLEAARSILADCRRPLRGSLQGGSARAVKEICAHTLGSAMAGKTQVRVGADCLPPELAQAPEEELARLKLQLRSARARLQAPEEQAAQDTAELRAKLRLAEGLLEHAVLALERRRDTTQRLLAAPRAIAIFGMAYPGTELIVDGVAHAITSDLAAQRIVREGGRLVGRPLG